MGTLYIFILQFNVIVWGTVSDWIMILVTSVTILLLRLTFMEQRRSNEIALNKDKREVRPIFDIVDSGGQYLTVELMQNVAFKLRIIPSNENLIIEQPLISSIKTGDKIQIHFKEFIMNNTDGSILIAFHDIDDRFYTQKITGFDVIPSISFPYETPEYKKFFPFFQKITIMYNSK